MNNHIESYQARIEGVLDTRLSSSISLSAQLLDAMRYSTLGGGKRIRALLCYAAGMAVKAPLEKLDIVAAALECIHSYSLIHDDLPAMDDDDLRRGKPTNHKQFDEATAILAGDALLTFAFELISNDDNQLNAMQRCAIMQSLSSNAGAKGMVGGQMLDILATESAQTLDELEAIHRGKTGALIQSAVMCGGYCSEKLSKTTMNALQEYATHLGLAFQVVDDILDIESSTDVLGKTNGSDQALGKATYPAILGLAESKQLAHTLYQQAIASLDIIGDNTELLHELAALVVNRVH